jgi:uncharacterized protein YkwD
MRREPQPRRRPGRPRSRASATALGILLLAGVVALVLRLAPTEAAQTTLEPGLLSFAAERTPPLYAPDDPWRDYLAPENACPGGESRAAALEVQQRTAICLINWARVRGGVKPLAEQPLLARAALLKAAAISRCQDFSHGACGEDPHAVVDRVGFAGGWGENLYAGGPDGLGSARVAVDRWLNSPGHRENMLSADWTEQGVALLPVSSFEGRRDVVIWVSHFGRG